MKKKLIIGVDVGGTRTKYGLVETISGTVLETVVLPTEQQSAELFMAQLESVIRQFRNSHNNIEAICFGIPGFTNEKQQVVTTYGFLHFMETYALQQIVEAEFSLPCFVDNDARVVSLGEALYGKGRNYERVITLTLGTGVGFGLVINKKFTDVTPLAHMGGHMKINDDEVLCYCGKTGCLESLISAGGIVRIAGQKGLQNVVSVESVFRAALESHQNAIRVVEMICTYLHTAIHNYVNLFAPDIIVIGGGVAKSLSPYLEKIKGIGYLSPYPSYQFDLVVSELEERAGMLGCAALYQTQNRSDDY